MCNLSKNVFLGDQNPKAKNKQRSSIRNIKKNNLKAVETQQKISSGSNRITLRYLKKHKILSVREMILHVKRQKKLQFPYYVNVRLFHSDIWISLHWALGNLFYSSKVSAEVHFSYRFIGRLKM